MNIQVNNSFISYLMIKIMKTNKKLKNKFTFSYHIILANLG